MVRRPRRCSRRRDAAGSPIAATRYSGSYDLLHAGFADPDRGRRSGSRRSCSPVAHARSTRRRCRAAGGATRGRPGPRGAAARDPRHLPGRVGDDRRRRLRACCSPSRRPATAGRRHGGAPCQSRLHCAVPCSRSAQACARPARARASTSTRWSSARRCAPSTCARSRRSSSTSCPGTRTSRASCARTRTRSGMDGQLYVDEYNSRYVAGEEESAAAATRRVPTQHRRAAPAPRVAARRRSRSTAIVAAHRARDRRLEVRRPGRAEGAGRQRSCRPRRPRRSPRWRLGHRDEGRLVHGGAGRLRGRQAALPRHARARPDEAVRASAASTLTLASPRNVVVRVAGVRVQGAGERAADDRRRALETPRAAIVVTGSELVRGERTDLQRPVLRPGGAAARAAAGRGSRSSATTPTSSRRRCARASRPTSASSPAASARRTTTARSSSSPAWPDGRCDVDDGARERDRADLAARSPSGCGARTPTSRRACASRRRCPRGRSRSGSQAPRPVSCSTRAPCVVVVLPGPPGELQRLWPRARRRPSRCSACWRGTTTPERRVLRFYGASESVVAKALADAGGDGDGVEVTICARDFEIHVDLIVEPGAEERADALEGAFVAPARALPLRPRRAIGAGARARALPRARPHARHGGVVHGRPRRGAADVGPRRERRLPRRCRRLRQRRQGGGARRPGRGPDRPTAPCRPRSRRRWRTARASGSGSTSPSR